MSRQPRTLQPGYCYHITTRCNNREFRLTRWECRKVFLYAKGVSEHSLSDRTATGRGLHAFRPYDM
jgi:REP element-mobilizing transposase RayT